MGRQYAVISCSGYVEVPVDLWEKHIESKYRDQAPKLMRHEDGSERWHLLEFERDTLGDVTGGVGYDEARGAQARSYHNPDGSLRPGCGDGTQRLKEQDQDGIDAEVLFPPNYLGSFLRPLAQRDRDAYLAIVRGYNTYLAEEYCAPARDRLLGVALIPETSIEDALVELKRCRRLGLRSINLTTWPNGGAAFKPEDDRFFATAVDLDVSVCSYPGIGVPTVGTNPGAAPKRIEETEAPATVMRSIGGAPGVGGLVASSINQLLNSGVFDRLPKLRVYFAETQAGWLAFYLDLTDELYQRSLAEVQIKLKQRPTGYIRDHMLFGFTSDRTAMKCRYDIGLDLLVWGSGSPHGARTFPHSREYLTRQFEGVPSEERRQVLLDNPCRFFGLEPGREITETP